MNRNVSSRSLNPSGPRTTGGRRRLASGVAALLVAGLIAGWSAPAAALDYYVDRGSAACLNSGAGTRAVDPVGGGLVASLARSKC